jgi:hypothetical protein
VIHVLTGSRNLHTRDVRFSAIVEGVVALSLAAHAPSWMYRSLRAALQRPGNYVRTELSARDPNRT